MSLPQRFARLCMLTDEAITETERSALIEYYNEFGQSEVYEYARKKKILPFFAHRLMSAGCDVSFWRDIHQRYVDRNQKVIRLLDEVFLALEREGLHKVCVAENFAAVLSSGACLGCFCSGDVDFYCDDVDVEKLNMVMEGMGFIWSDRHKRKKSFAREYRSVDAIGEEFWLNFQWKPMTRKKTHLYDQRYILKRYHTLFDEIEHYKDTHIKYFKPEAALYLNCVHIASGHYYILAPGIRLYADIDRPVRYRSIDWKLLNKWVQEDRLGIRSDMVLHLCSQCMHTPVDEKVYTVLAQRKQFDRLKEYLISDESGDFRLPSRGIFPYLLFLSKVELMSDGTGLLSAFLRRLWVMLTDWK